MCFQCQARDAGGIALSNRNYGDFGRVSDRDQPSWRDQTYMHGRTCVGFVVSSEKRRLRIGSQLSCHSDNLFRYEISLETFH
jgi:hypothetical protein